MYDIRAIAGVLMKDYVSKLFLSDKSIIRCTATTKAQMDCSFHEEKCNSIIVDHGGNDEVSESGTCLQPTKPSTVASKRIHTVTIKQSHFLSITADKIPLFC